MKKLKDDKESYKRYQIAWNNLSPQEVLNSFDHPTRYFPRFLEYEDIEGEVEHTRKK